MNNKKFIFNCIVIVSLIFYFAFCIERLINDVKSICTIIEMGEFDFKYYNQNGDMGFVFTTCINSTIFDVFSIIICFYSILKTILSTFFAYEFRYRYEKYKKIRDKQNLEKQTKSKQQKIEALKQQLSDLENTD